MTFCKGRTEISKKRSLPLVPVQYREFEYGLFTQGNCFPHTKHTTGLFHEKNKWMFDITITDFMTQRARENSVRLIPRFLPAFLDIYVKPFTLSKTNFGQSVQKLSRCMCPYCPQSLIRYFAFCDIWFQMHRIFSSYRASKIWGKRVSVWGRWMNGLVFAAAREGQPPKFFANDSYRDKRHYPPCCTR